MLHALGEVFSDIQEHKQQNGVYQPRRFIAILQKQNGESPTRKQKERKRMDSSWNGW